MTQKEIAAREIEKRLQVEQGTSRSLVLQERQMNEPSCDGWTEELSDQDK